MKANLFEQIHGLVYVRVGEVDTIEDRDFCCIMRICVMFDHVGTWKKNNEGGPQIPETVCFVCTFAMRRRKSEWLFAYIGMLSRRPQGPQPLPPPTHSSHSFFAIFQKKTFLIFLWLI